MMHMFGGGFGFGFFPFFGFLPLLIFGGLAYLLFRRLQGGRAQRPQGPGPRRVMESEIYRLAKKNGGTLTVSDVVVETGIDPEEAESLLRKITDGYRVQMDVTEAGRIRYRFTELQNTK